MTEPRDILSSVDLETLAGSYFETEPLTIEAQSYKIAEEAFRRDPVPSRLPDFIKHYSPTYQVYPHIRQLADLFALADRREDEIRQHQDAERRHRDETGDPYAQLPDRPKPIRAIILMPPQHGKTETELHDIARYVSQHQDRTAAFVGYNTAFAQSKVSRAISLMERARVEADPRRANLSEYRTVQGGGLLSGGIGSGLTGQRVDRLYVDDPIKNRKEAESPTIRDGHWDWWNDVAETRLHESSSVFITLTRWHEDDLAGRLIKVEGLIEDGGQWIVIRLPAIADGLDPLGRDIETSMWKPFYEFQRDARKIGQPLCPDLHSLESLESVQERKPFTFTSLYQGLPRGRHEKLFGDAHFYEREDLPVGLRISIGGDLAYTKKTHANFSAVCVMGERADTFYILHAEKWQEKIGESIKKLKRLQRTFKVKVELEANGPQKAVCDTVEDGGVKVGRQNPRHDKYAEAQEFAEDWNAGRVLIPRDAEWVDDFLEVLQNFTGIKDAEDDYVDAGVRAHTRLMRRKRRKAPPVRSTIDRRE